MQTLIGNWKLALDPRNEGREGGWFATIRPEAVDAPVPGNIKQVFPGAQGVAWYWLAFRATESPAPGERMLLRFGAVDYLADVWLNGQAVGSHEGGETPFTLDVTAAWRPAAENLLAVRVLSPADDPIDGLRLKEVPHSAGWGFGGIVLPVEWERSPAARIADVFVEPDWQCGALHVSVTVQNGLGHALAGRLTLTVGPDKTGDVLTGATVAADLRAGETIHKVCLTVAQHRLWDLSAPFLYRVRVVLTVESAGCAHEKAVRCGFRDFRVRDGFFFFNGRRTYLRCCHTAAIFPVTGSAPDQDLMRRDMLYAKACGFNCVRFLSKMALPEQLDLCDEIGLMIYEEPYASWWFIGDPEGGGYTNEQWAKPAMMSDPEVIRARYENSFREMILRDRNHPCITVWGMLTEQPDGRLFRMAVETLQVVRSLDATRLVVLGSGRWDADLSVGSVSNPGAPDWERVWGAEGDPKATYPTFSDHNGPTYTGQGDFHPYPKLPVRDEDKMFLRTVGDTLKPVFISEGGFGFMMDFIGQLRRYDQAGVRADHGTVAQLRPVQEKLNADLRRFGMDALYPFPQDMMRDSQRLNLRQRRLWFDLLRSNPNICGHSLTSMCGGLEGFWDAWREMNPGIGDVLRDGWAPLRWCLFAEPIHGYVGRPIRLEAVLANEDVLQSGSYPVTFRVWGETGIVWEKRVKARLPAKGKGGRPPLAVPVLNENVSLDLPPGEYTFAASLEAGGAPAGDRMKFRLSDPATLSRVNQPVTVWGIPARVRNWLVRQGVSPRALTGSRAAPHEVILVGKPAKTAAREWREVLRRIDAGAVAVFMDPEAFDAAIWAPCPLRKAKDWLYHKEYLAKSHAVMNGLQTHGMLDPDYYGPLFAPRMFDKEPAAQEVVVAAFACGHTDWDPNNYASGVVIGRYARGRGQYLLNALAVLDHVDRHPAADRLLLNLIGYAATRAQGAEATQG